MGINKAWKVTICAIGINMVLGMIYSWSVFAVALVNELGLTKTQAQIPYTTAILTLALLSVPGGKLQDRLGPRVITTIGGILAGAGMIIAGFAESITIFTAAFGLISGTGIGLAYAATTPAAVKWFPPQKRGLISGMVVAGVGLASVYVAPMTQYFIDNFGVNQAFWMEGIIFGVSIIIMSQFISNPPQGYVYAASLTQVAKPAAKPPRDYSPSEMITTTQFWLIWLMYGFGSVAGLMIVGHMAIIAKIQANVAWAYVFVSILSIFNAAGRVIGGFLTDKIGGNKTLIAMFLLQAINMVLFKFYTTSPLLIFGIAWTGIAYGSLLAVFPTLTFNYFGIKNGGVNYGLVFTSWGVAGVIGPIMAGRIVDHTKSYNNAFIVAAGLLLFSVILVLLLKAPKQKTGNKPIAARKSFAKQN